MAPVKILGIDPGSRTTGYALLLKEGKKHLVLECNVIRSDHLGQAERLRHIYENISEIIDRHKPDSCAVETPVYGVDPLAMLKLGRAQAAALLAITTHDLEVSEYYPKAVKKAVTGNGNSDKKQVAWMLERLITFPSNRLTADATDALAVAWCHLLSNGKAVSSDKNYHQNNRASGWKAFVENNPDRVKS